MYDDLVTHGPRVEASSRLRGRCLICGECHGPRAAAVVAEEQRTILLVFRVRLERELIHIRKCALPLSAIGLAATLSRYCSTLRFLMHWLYCKQSELRAPASDTCGIGDIRRSCLHVRQVTSLFQHSISFNCLRVLGHRLARRASTESVSHTSLL